MTKKHYERIAAIIAYRADMQYPADKVGYGAATLRILAGELADFFASDNPRFDRARFLQACGIEACNGKHKTIQELSNCKDCAPYFEKDRSQP